MRTVSHITLQHSRIDVTIIGNDKIDDLVAGLLIDGLDVIGDGIVIRFPLLGHDVANIDFRRFTVSDSFDDIRDAQIGHDARIETPRPQNDGIGTFDSVDSRPDSLRVFRRRKDALDTAMGMRNLRLTFDDAPIGHLGIEPDFFCR